MAASVPLWYRSATEYQFRQEQADDIVRTAAYHRKDYCLTVIRFSPWQHLCIGPSISPSFGGSSNTALDSLQRLPLELLHDVVIRLDMRSLFKFRQVSRRSREAVDSLKEYQMVALHGLDLFCALLRMGLATAVSLFDFYIALCTKSCALCGEFSGFIFLPTWIRCCFKCLQVAPETQIQTLAAVQKQFHLDKPSVDLLRPFKTLPGIYSMHQSVQESHITAVSVYEAMLVLRQIPGVRTQQTHQDNRALICKFNFMGSCSLPYYDRRIGRVEHGLSCAGCQLALERVITGPGARWTYEARDKVYAADGFLEHFRWCTRAQLLWKSSKEGTRQPVEFPEFARRGGYLIESEWEREAS